MILENFVIATAAGEKKIWIEGGKVKSFNGNDESVNDDIRVRFENAIAFPGLINSHDHLEFNLFPLLANRTYPNYTEWANDIQRTSQSLISEVTRIPKWLRIKWSCYKNLLNGFTTVVNHGAKINVDKEIVSVLQPGRALHSTAFEKNWKWKLNNPFSSQQPFVMHIGEGNDSLAKKEIDEVIKWNKLRRRIIAVHGIAMDSRQAAAFKGLIWCPASNYSLIGETADIKMLREKLPVVFGTDSTVSAGWNAWEHFREAILKTQVSEKELMDMLMIVPNELWDLNKDDLVIAEKQGRFFDINPENILLIIRDGQVVLYDETIADKIDLGFGFIKVNARKKFVVGDVQGLINEIRSYKSDIEFTTTSISQNSPPVG